MANAHTTEKAFNIVLSSALRNKHPLWKENLSAEQTRVIQGSPGQQPDIVLSLDHCSPVVVETEFMPASTVQDDAKSRLGKKLSRNNYPIEHCMALRIPQHLRLTPQSALEDSIECSSFEYSVYSVSETNKSVRWPRKGWLTGTINDVANCIENISLTESLVTRSTKILEDGVSQAASILATTEEKIQQDLGELLRQSPGTQTNRMASAIIANAMIFHSRTEGEQNIPVMDDFVTHLGMSKAKILSCWRWIISNVNYWPIFKIASDLLGKIPSRQASLILKRLHEMSSELSLIGATGLNDLSGRMFQKLIADRKFLATFYTLPVSATFLAELTLLRIKVNWQDSEAVKELKIADFACGTGTLIGALYHAILTQYRRGGNDDRVIHSEMLEKALYAFDIMPAATHLTASTLSNKHPSTTFGTTKIVTMPYGKDASNVSYIGSLDLLKQESGRSLLSLGRKQLIGREVNDENKQSDSPLELVFDSEIDHDFDMRHESLDIVIMNPPFTRPTNHKIATVPVPSFAGFNTSDEEQSEMSKQLKKLTNSLNQPVGNGYAGLASHFMDLAHVKLKPGGVLGLVLPATFVAGSSWNKARNLLQSHYQDLTIVSITNVGATEAAFSADTGMAEVLVIATKKMNKVGNNSKGMPGSDKSTFQFVNLRQRPPNHTEACEIAKFIHRKSRQIGTGRIELGSEDSCGNFLNESSFQSGFAGLSEPNLADFMRSLSKGSILSTRTNEIHEIPMVNLSALGVTGIGHRSISSKSGAFNKVTLKLGGIPNFPALWSHDAKKERTFFVESDCELLIREGQKSKASEIWKQNASRLHLNLDFRLNSQSLSACLTTKKTLGGSAWPNFLLENTKYEKAMMLWFNSTLGLINHWWTGSKQHKGRSRITVSQLPQLLSIDFRSFDTKTINATTELFDNFCRVKFLPANESYRDKNRIALDDELFVGVLGVSKQVMRDFEVIRKQWCAEPSVHGGKGTAPPIA